jgi:hypothetical protein
LNTVRSSGFSFCDISLCDRLITEGCVTSLAGLALAVGPRSATLHRRERAGGSLPWGMG